MDHLAPAAPSLAPMPSLDRLALSATLHCLGGCALGEVLGMVIGKALDWSAGATIAQAMGLAYVFGYLATMVPLVRTLGLKAALGIALGADTASIAVMEVVDNAVMFGIPGAMDAPLTEPFFWVSLAAALAIAAVFAFPVNRWLIARGRGHVHLYRHHRP